MAQKEKLVKAWWIKEGARHHLTMHPKHTKENSAIPMSPVPRPLPIHLQTLFIPPWSLPPSDLSHVPRALLALNVSSFRGTQKQQEVSHYWASFSLHLSSRDLRCRLCWRPREQRTTGH